jgi:hypothetical protein
MEEESGAEGEAPGPGGGRRDEAQGDVSGYVSRDDEGGNGRKGETATGASVGGRPKGSKEPHGVFLPGARRRLTAG